MCLLAILEDANAFIDALLFTARGIEQDESREAICEEWRSRLDHSHPPHDFDELIARVARDMGRPGIDPVVVRRRYYQTWIAALRLLQPGYDFETEARSLVEEAFLDEGVRVMPITGRDVMLVCGVPPGPRVGEILEQVRKRYQAARCTREELLEYLRKTCCD